MFRHVVISCDEQSLISQGPREPGGFACAAAWTGPDCRIDRPVGALIVGGSFMGGHSGIAIIITVTTSEQRLEFSIAIYASVIAKLVIGMKS